MAPSGSPEEQARAGDTMPVIQNQTELPSRRMLDSYREAVIPLGSQPEIRQKYVNHFNSVRYGRLMEDLDTMAVWISYTHHVGADFDGKCEFSIVTAMVDSIKVNIRRFVPDGDILIRGHTTWVGKSSIEATMDVDQECEGEWQHMMTAKFLMVTRNPKGPETPALCPLELVTEEERSLQALGQASKEKRREEASHSLLKRPPNAEERDLIHSLFTDTVDKSIATFKHPVKPEGAVWMENTLLKNIHVCFPQDRNLYNKIFGGFLMRQSFELAWANACLYCKSRPVVTAVDDIFFCKPVNVGSLLFMSCQIVYTKGPYMELRVHAEVVNSATKEHETTNVFHYTFLSHDGDVPVLMPKSYAEYMIYLDGKRHFES